MNLKNIHIGTHIKQKVRESDISMQRICNFLACEEEDISDMFLQKSIDTNILLRWCKLLEYDFFRFYTGHLILYSPPAAQKPKVRKEEKSNSENMNFRKNIYTQEVKDFILEKLDKKEMTINEIIAKYRIPKTTLYRWTKKAPIK
ncbi:transcriptional regulator with PAS, ATPase and Fis domain [Chryseobacterium defluvii]|uniref:Transcriptional regulator with PAS, ATPase and Fis domain n=1 Tax=Chryseobacterium defluvii TaxID=160396 RepID=A0A840KD60_9FLAO|nr:transposase [Chryseobacterium defluvii]MBB4805938.1 transcriptional regulator with PAS, ATPase and Fis domain [Chryseobacterium defluvii]